MHLFFTSRAFKYTYFNPISKVGFNVFLLISRLLFVMCVLKSSKNPPTQKKKSTQTHFPIIIWVKEANRKTAEHYYNMHYILNIFLWCESFKSSIKCCDACWKCCLSTCQATKCFKKIPTTTFFHSFFPTFSSCRIFCHPYTQSV